MSVIAVNTVVQSPIGPTRLIMDEASSHIQTLRCKFTVSGSRSYTDGTNNYSETLSGTWENTLTRISVRTSGTPFVFEGGSPEIEDESPDFIDYLDYTLHQNPDKFTLIQSAGYSMAMQEFFANLPTKIETQGTHSYDTGGAPTVGDIDGNVLFSPLFAISGTPTNYRTPADVWRLSTTLASNFGTPETLNLDIDISAWSNAQWRAKTGVYSVTHTETDWPGITGGTSTVQGTWEWEFS